MKTERRHELQTNALADRIGKSVELIEQNYRAVVGVLVALLIMVAVYFYISGERTASRTQAWDRYFKALNQNDMVDMMSVADTYSDTAAGAWARLTIADQSFAQGVSQLLQNKAEANDQLHRAIDAYDQVLKSAAAQQQPLLAQRALWGLARSHESQNQLDKARDAYAQLAEPGRWTDPIFATEAQRRLKALEQQSTKQFYDWFARQEPLTPAGTPAATKLDLESLPDSPPPTSPPAGDNAASQSSAEAAQPAGDATPPAGEAAPTTSEATQTAAAPADPKPADAGEAPAPATP